MLVDSCCVIVQLVVLN